MVAEMEIDINFGESPNANSVFCAEFGVDFAVCNDVVYKQNTGTLSTYL